MEQQPLLEDQLKLFSLRKDHIALHHYLSPNVIEITFVYADNYQHDDFVEDLSQIHELYPTEPPNLAA